jgi:NAD(P)H-hydrate epimerase
MPMSVLAAGLSITPELIGLGLEGKGAVGKLMAAAEMADAVIVGPGMGRSAETGRRVKALLGLAKPMVVDADALNILSAEKSWPKWIKARCVLTPHPGEMNRLVKFVTWRETPDDDAGRGMICYEAAQTFEQVVVLKGRRTVVCDEERHYSNDTGNSSLAKAGTGDVLAGAIGCLLAQKMDAFEAAVLGVWLHGRAGEIAGKRLGRRSVLARDVIEALGEAIGEAKRRHR